MYGNPVLVVLDEPNSNLDSAGEQALTEAIQRMKRSGTTVVLISHRSKILRQADHMLMLKDGAAMFLQGWQQLGIGLAAAEPRGRWRDGWPALDEQCPAALSGSGVAPVEAPYPTSCARTLACRMDRIGDSVRWLRYLGSVAPLSSAAIAPGTVVVDSNRKSVQHLEGGVIREILVRDGDPVEAGQVLLRLDGANVRAAIASLQPMLATNKAYKARLLAERDGLDQIEFAEDLVAEAETDPATAQILAGQQAGLRDAAQCPGRGKGPERQPAGAKPAKVGGPGAAARGQGTRDGAHGRELADQQILSATATPLRAVSLRQNVPCSSSRANTPICNRRWKRRRSWLNVTSWKMNRSTRISLSRWRTSYTRSSTESYQLLERMRAIQDQYGRLDVRAPVSGRGRQHGRAHGRWRDRAGKPNPGHRAGNDELMIEAQVRPADIDGVKAGLSADVRFPAFNSTEIPRLSGHVTRVSADRLTESSGAPYFLVRVQVSEHRSSPAWAGWA